MKRAPRYPSRWAGRWRPLIIAAALTGLGACTSVDNTFYGARGGTMEYPGSGAGPNAVPVYVVKDKDTVDLIAQRYGVTTQSIVDRNKLQPPYPLRPGQTLEVPGARVIASAPPTEASAPQPAGSIKKESLAPPNGTGQTAAEPSKPAVGEPTQLQPAAATAPPAGPTPQFQWPLRGKILTSYGTGAGGQKSDGIDIEAANGAPVKAADGGTVVYAGSEVAHLGNLLLVEHSSGYITAYGNNESLLAKKGDAVKKGQTIARAGSSGGAASPRLHFEIRRGGSKTIDPVTMLPVQ